MRVLILFNSCANSFYSFYFSGFFLTKVFHPNVKQESGEICVNTLKKDWLPSHGLRHVLMVIRCLLIEPFPESALNEEAAKLMLEDYGEYFRRAKMFTGVHAKDMRITQVSKDEFVSNSVAFQASLNSTKNDKKLDKKKKPSATVMLGFCSSDSLALLAA